MVFVTEDSPDSLLAIVDEESSHSSLVGVERGKRRLLVFFRPGEVSGRSMLVVFVILVRKVPFVTAY